MHLKRILTYQVKNPVANLAWLTLLGFVVYVFIFVNYAASQTSHFGRFYTDAVVENGLSVTWIFISLWVFLMEFMLSFPSQYWYVRLWMGIFTIFILLYCLPTL